GRLLIVSNRLPVTVSGSEKGGRPVVRASVGGLATGLRTPHEQSQGLWLGWPGDTSTLDDAGRAEVQRQLESRRLVGVDLSPEEVSVFYDRIANSVLWPVCHDRLDQLPLRVEGWDVYEQVNARFADAVAAVWKPDDRIWVHDFARRAESEAVRTEAARLRRHDAGPLLVGIDRLDYSKGIPRRLLAVEQ